MDWFFRQLDALADYFAAGGGVMWPLVVLLLVLWFALGWRFALLRRGSRRGARVLLDRVGRDDPAYRMRDGILVRAARLGLALKSRGLPDLRRRLDDAFAAEERNLRRHHVLVTTIVLVAPLLGLLGTVAGMIETFDSLAEMSLFSQSGGIAGGISQALFTTQMGLLVSIPGLIVNGVLGRRARDIELELNQLKDILCTA